MRFIFLFLCASLASFGQSPVPELFPSGNSKWFVFQSRSFSLKFDSVRSQSQETFYYPYTTVRKEWKQSDWCEWWGADLCYPHNKATWMGPIIKQVEGTSYIFYTVFNDSLTFDFDLSIGDSSLVFSNDSLQLFLYFFGVQNQTVLGMDDSIWSYRLKAYDMLGNVSNGILNDLPVDLGKSLGLIRFLQVDSFPLAQVPVELSGDENRQKGMYQLTHGMIYDFEPGDEFQHSIYSTVSPGPPESNYQYYEHFRVLQRSEDPDSLYYQLLITTYSPEADSQWTRTLDTAWYKHKIIKALPYEEYDGVKRTMTLESWDVLRWTYTITEDDYLRYCPEENCWGPQDLQGPGGYFEDQYILGVGETHYTYIVGTTGGWYSSRGSSLVYFKKGNSEWGDKKVLSLGEQRGSIQVRVFPQPASNQFRVVAPMELYDVTLQITDLQGKLIATYTKTNGKQWMMDCSSWASGVYQLQLIAKDVPIFQGRVLVIGD